MKKRDFLKTGIIGALGLVSLPTLARVSKSILRNNSQFKIPELPYSYDAFEPSISKGIMKAHHLEHHTGYADRLNYFLGKAGLPKSNARAILRDASKFPTRITDNAGGFVNHKIFWRSISPNGGGMPTGDIARCIKRDFGSFEKLKEEFNSAAASQIDSGWVWLVDDKDKLKVVTTENQDNPIMDTLPDSKKGHPLLCLDLGDHAYLSDRYDSRDYIETFWNIVNWKSANVKLTRSRKVN